MYIMWFKFATFNEKVKFMFNNELPLDMVEFENFIFYARSSLRLVFNTHKVPQVYPDKWNKNEFNALTIKLDFYDIIMFSCNGNTLGFECTPIIESTKDETSLTIIKNGFNLKIKSKTMSIGEISPYLDERWIK